MDSPVSPGNRGMSLFKSSLTDTLRQQHRSQLFTAGRDELVDVAQRLSIAYLFPIPVMNSNGLTLFSIP